MCPVFVILKKIDNGFKAVEWKDSPKKIKEPSAKSKKHINKYSTPKTVCGEDSDEKLFLCPVELCGGKF